MVHMAHAAVGDNTVVRARILDATGKTLAALDACPAFEPELEARLPSGGEVRPSEVTVQRNRSQLLVVAPIWRGADDLDLGLDAPREERNEAGQSPVGYACLIYGIEELQGARQSQREKVPQGRRNSTAEGFQSSLRNLKSSVTGLPRDESRGYSQVSLRNWRTLGGTSASGTPARPFALFFLCRCRRRTRSISRSCTL